jgi:hypothetical protein
MQLEAIYDRGKLSFAQPVKLRNDHVRLAVNVPDHELEFPQLISKELSLSATRVRLNAILGPFRSSGDTSGHAEYKAICHAHLEDKYLAGR